MHSLWLIHKTETVTTENDIIVNGPTYTHWFFPVHVDVKILKRQYIKKP